MLKWLVGKLQKRAQVRQSDRTERNAVIRRIVTAAATTTPKREEASVEHSPGPAADVSATDSGGIPKDRVAERAYDIWVRNGRPTGTADQDWRQAMQELATELAAAP